MTGTGISVRQDLGVTISLSVELEDNDVPGGGGDPPPTSANFILLEDAATDRIILEDSATDFLLLED